VMSTLQLPYTVALETNILSVVRAIVQNSNLFGGAPPWDEVDFLAAPNSKLSAATIASAFGCRAFRPSGVSQALKT
jgi:hypothetical protein